MREVSALGYVVVSAADLGAWSEFAQQGLGLQVGTAPPVATDRETLFLRVDDRAWRLAIEKGEDDTLLALGFEVPDPGTLDALSTRLESAGVPVKEAPEVAAQRRVDRVVQATDPCGARLGF